MARSKPTIVLAHGSWHSPEHYSTLMENLKHHGYKTNSVWLPTMHYSRASPPLDPAKVSLLDDISAVRNAIIEELSTNSKTDIVVISHSSGTLPASSAIEDLDKRTREKEGHQNGVRAFLIMTGILVPAGITTFDWAGGQVPPTVSLSTIAHPQDSSKEIQVSNPICDPGPIALFYHDLPDQDEAKRYAEMCTHQIWTVNTTTIPFSGWKVPAIEVHYLVCEEDRALPPGFQHVMIENADRERAAVETEGAPNNAGNHGGDLLEKFQKDSLAGIEEYKANLEGVKAGKGEELMGDEGEAAIGLTQDGAREAGGIKIHVTSINSGHSPFLSHVEETAQWVRRACGEDF